MLLSTRHGLDLARQIQQMLDEFPVSPRAVCAALCRQSRSKLGSGYECDPGARGDHASIETLSDFSTGVDVFCCVLLAAVYNRRKRIRPDAHRAPLQKTSTP